MCMKYRIAIAFKGPNGSYIWRSDYFTKFSSAACAYKKHVIPNQHIIESSWLEATK